MMRKYERAEGGTMGVSEQCRATVLKSERGEAGDRRLGIEHEVTAFSAAGDISAKKG